MSTLIFNVYMQEVMKEMKLEIRRKGVRFSKKKRDWRLHSFLHVDDLILLFESEEDMESDDRKFC